MEINNKLFFVATLLTLSLASCQTKKLYFNKYENLSLEKKKVAKILFILYYEITNIYQ